MCKRDQSNEAKVTAQTPGSSNNTTPKAHTHGQKVPVTPKTPPPAPSTPPGAQAQAAATTVELLDQEILRRENAILKTQVTELTAKIDRILHGLGELGFGALDAVAKAKRAEIDQLAKEAKESQSKSIDALASPSKASGGAAAETPDKDKASMSEQRPPQSGPSENLLTQEELEEEVRMHGLGSSSTPEVPTAESPQADEPASS